MKKIYFFIFILFLSTTVNAVAIHQIKIDSLLVLINNSTESVVQVERYNALCTAYKLYDLKKAQYYNNKVLLLSQKLKYRKGIGYYYINAAGYLFFSNQVKKSINFATKAVLIFNETKTFTNYFRACCTLADYLICDAQYVIAQQLLYKSLNMALVTKNTVALCGLYTQLSHLYNAQSNYKPALVYAKIAVNNSFTGANKITAYDNIAVIYSSLHNFKMALFYNRCSYELAESPLRKKRIMFVKTHILIAQKKYKEALNICLKSEVFFEAVNDKNLLVYSILNSATCYFNLQKYTLAQRQLNKISKNAPDNIEVLIKIFELKSNIYLAIGNVSKSKFFIDKALALLQPNDYYELKQLLFLTKSKVERAAGNYRSALLYNEKYTIITITENAKVNNYKINELQVDFEVTDKNNIIKSLEIADSKKAILHKERKDYLMYIGVALFFCVLLLLYFAKYVRLAAIGKKLIEVQKTSALKSLNEKETLLKEVHHRVKNNLQLVMSLLRIQARDTGTTINDFLEVSQSRIASMSLVHENLYQSDNDSRVDFKEYLINLTNNILQNYESTTNSITVKIDVVQVYLNMQTAVSLGLILNELISNAYKHAFTTTKNGALWLQLTKNNDNYCLTVRDNGSGIKDTTRPKKTLGLQLVDKLIFQINGSLQVKTDHGTQYSIQFKNAVPDFYETVNSN